MICIIAVILICCILHRRKMRAQLLKIEKELEMARAYRREKELKERGEGEGMALRDTIAQEAFSPTSMSSMMMGGVSSHDVGG